MTRRWLSLTCAVGAAALAACTPDNPTAPPATALGSAPSTRPSFALSGGVSGANFTTTNPNWDRPKAGTTPKLCLHGQDLQTGTNNCNIYGAKPYLWLNGGPMAAGLESGTYFWAVLAPGGQPDPNDGSAKNLSDDTDPVSNRTFSWNKGTGAITYSGTHDFDPVTQKLRVGVKPPLVKKGPDWFADTPNPGGVYILAICRISAPSSAPVNPRDCKYDAFKIKDQPGNPEVMVSIVPNGVNEVAKDHKFTVTVKAVGGRLPYTFQITPTVDPAAGLKSETCTDATKHVVVDEFVRTCDVTVNSSAVGLVKVNIAAKVTDANGNAATATTGPSNLPSSDDGYKYYVDASIKIAEDGKNGINEPHKFTATFTAVPRHAAVAGGDVRRAGHHHRGARGLRRGYRLDEVGAGVRHGRERAHLRADHQQQQGRHVHGVGEGTGDHRRHDRRLVVQRRARARDRRRRNAQRPRQQRPGHEDLLRRLDPLEQGR
jgi:hypothetical protein